MSSPSLTQPRLSRFTELHRGLLGAMAPRPQPLMVRSISSDKRESATSEQERTKRRSADKAHRRDLWPLDTSKANGHTHRTGLSQKPIAAMASKASKVDIKLDPIWEDLDWYVSGSSGLVKLDMECL